MKRKARALALLLAGCALAGPAWAADDLEGRWSRARNALKRGAYREALQAIEEILAVAPDDPKAQLYHALCEQRLASPSTFPRLAPEEIARLERRLREEEREQQRARARRTLMERELRQEQVRWDAGLAAAEGLSREEAVRASERGRGGSTERAGEEPPRREAAATEPEAPPPQPRAEPPTAAEEPPEAPARARAPSGAPRETAREPEPAPAAAQAPEAAAPEAASRAPAGAERPADVELEPVVVGAAEGKRPDARPGAPRARTKPPPGAVEIRARQMRVSPDRKIAVAEGDVEVAIGDAILSCDHLTLFTDTKDAYADGRARLEETGQVFRADMIHYNFETKKGRFLQGTVSAPPWHQHGRAIEHLAEGIYEVTPGYVTSCDLEPPHFRFAGRRSTVFKDDRLARLRHVALIVEDLPFFYLPALSVAERQSPFFIVPGKDKRWGEFALMGYRYELALPEGAGNQSGTLKVDWRRRFGWGTGVEHHVDSPQLGQALFKVYYNDLKNRTRPNSELPKGAREKRYRLLWRHKWRPIPDTTVLTDIQKFSDVDFRKELLFKEEHLTDETPETFVSLVKNSNEFMASALLRQRMNRFQSVTEAYPELKFQAVDKQIVESRFFSSTTAELANVQTKERHSDSDTDGVRLGWTQEIKYALGLFRPVEVTPRLGVRQNYYNKDKQGGAERPDGRRDVIGGQLSGGFDSSLKLFRIFPVRTNALGLNINWLRHVVTPTIGYTYIHRPTVPNTDLSFGAAEGAKSQMTLGIENKLQTKRWIGPEPGPAGEGRAGAAAGGVGATGPEKRAHEKVDIARALASAPYTFRGHENKVGGQLEDWSFDVELYPWSWMRLDMDWTYPSHFVKGSRDRHLTNWHMDLIMVGNSGKLAAQDAPKIRPRAPLVPLGFQAGPREATSFLLPEGDWFLGMRHSYAQDSRTEAAVQFDWRVSRKWEIGMYQRFTLKEVIESSKRFNHLREFQYSARRDLHDWLAEVVYRQDREYGEELYFTMTLKAYPTWPIELSETYHEPKIGSQSDIFSPLKGEHRAHPALPPEP